MENIYEILRHDDSDDERYTYDDDDYFRFLLNSSREQSFGKDEVNILYNYFLDKGKNKNKISWRINKQHIYWSLRKNDGDVNRSGSELEELLESKYINIRQYYIKRLNGEEELVDIPSKVPYLDGQEWLIEPKRGMYLFFMNQLYEIYEVHKNYIVICKVLSKSFSSRYVYFSDNEVKYGRYKLVEKDKRQYYCEEEYRLLTESFNNISVKKDELLNDKRARIQRLFNKIHNYKVNHANNCCVEAKLPLVCKFDLPEECIRKITEYGIQTDCYHIEDEIILLSEINRLYHDIDGAIMIYDSIKRNKEDIYEVLINGY